MNACPLFDHLLVLPRLQVQNANAVSSPLTHGFPAMTAFLGLMWRLERKVRAAGLDLNFNAIGVVCHDHDEQVSQDPFVKAFRLTRNPVDKDGSTAAIVEEGRIRLELSLVFAVHSQRWLDDPEREQREAEAAQIGQLLAGLRVAGGTLVPAPQAWRHRYRAWVLPLTGSEGDRDTEFRKARMRLLPGFALVARDDLLDARTAELQAGDAAASRLDAWLSLSRVNWRYEPPDQDSEKTRRDAWKNDRTGRGWIVPIPVGYAALGERHPAGRVANARDAATPFQFVESVYSIGEWISPHRLTAPQQLLWYAHNRPETGLYRCRNDYRPAADAFEPVHDSD